MSDYQPKVYGSDGNTCYRENLRKQTKTKTDIMYKRDKLSTKHFLQLAFLLWMCSCLSSCKSDSKQERREHDGPGPKTQERVFESSGWKKKNGEDYPFRNKMLDDLIDSQRLKTMKYNEVVTLLGEPDRTDSLYLFYRIEQKRIYSWPIHTKTLVIKLFNDSTVKWVKIHQ